MKKTPATEIAWETERKDMATRPLHTLFPTAPSAAAWERSLKGKISDVKTQQIGPIPTEKKATFPQTDKIDKAIPNCPCPSKERESPKLNKQIVIPIVLT